MDQQQTLFIIKSTSPEYFRVAEQSPWGDDAFVRIAAVAQRQYAEYVDFGLPQKVAEDLTASLVGLMSGYLKDHGQYMRLVTSTKSEADKRSKESERKKQWRLFR